ncbi:MAG TPA: zf-HC2 domain-containing protein [Dongiaceae bacterium]|nr:zf-HC2 domain-containing protein [Dongiaceae bacterium]
MDHQVCESLLPAYIHGHLDREQAVAVAQHLVYCVDCQRSLQLANQLRLQLATESDELIAGLQTERMEANFDRLWTDLDVENAGAQRHWMLRRWRIAAPLSLCVILALLWRLPLSNPSGDFRTLAEAPASHEAGQIRVLLADDLSQADLRRLLATAETEIVAGPGERGVLTLRSVDPDHSLQLLRQHPQVLLAELASY